MMAQRSEKAKLTDPHILCGRLIKDVSEPLRESLWLECRTNFFSEGRMVNLGD